MSKKHLQTLYRHPDGAELLYSSNGRLIITEAWDNDSEDSAAIDIGPVGLKALAHRLLALAQEVEVSHA